MKKENMKPDSPVASMEVQKENTDSIRVSNIDIAWNINEGRCSFENLPVAMMWVDTTLAGLMAGVQAMVGEKRFNLALQSEGRKSVDADWQVISQFPQFSEGFKAIANIAAVAGWGEWEIISLDMEKKEAVFQVRNSWEGLYQKALGVCWSSGMLAGKMAGYCTKLFGTNCWAEQSAYIARGSDYDKFIVKPSSRSIEDEIEALLATDEATRADMAVALEKLRIEMDERRMAEQASRKLEVQLQQSRKLEAIGQLAGGIAHDLNNMLAPILGYGEILLEENPEGETHGHADQIVQAAIRARDLIQQLLTFARKQTIELAPLDLNLVVSNFEKLLRRTIRENIDIKIQTESKTGTILGDSVQIEQIILNLAVNAQDAMPYGGQLSIATNEVQLDVDDAKRLGEISPGTYIKLSMRDSGLGMDEETLQKIFDPFYTTKGHGKGTGMGLATVYGIVRQHNGSIRAVSVAGKGSEFNVYFPKTNETGDKDIIPPPARKSLGTGTIMVVEDQDMVCNMVRKVLESRGYTVLIANSGEEAIEVVKKYQGKIHLLITDMVMTGMGGRELYHRLTTIIPHLKAIYMSGYTDEIIDEQGFIEKRIQFIKKPFSIESLVEKVKEVLNT